MAYVTPIGAAPEQVEYRLAGAHGCSPAEAAGVQFSYHADGRERPLVWTGAGLPEVGITPGSVLDEAQFEVARALMSGLDPRTGEQLVRPKLAVYEDAKVALAPLVAAVQATAGERGITAAQVFTSVKVRTAYARAERAVAAEGEAASLRADHAGAIADAAGVDVSAVWGEGAFAAAVANLSETQIVTDEEGRSSERVVPRRRVVGNLGYDVSFTLPKSHSLLLAFADEDTAAAVERVYAAGVADTFTWLETQTAYGMRGHHGDGQSASTVPGSGFLGWSMVHRAARPVGDRVVGDPHWHVHITIANMTRGEDGKWSTVAAGGRDLMRHAPAADHVLKALVRRQLVDRFGVEFARSERTGAWEVAAIPDATLRLFSKRGASIEAMLRDLGFDPQTATRRAEDLAAAQTRQDKTHATGAADVTLRQVWQEEARQAGTDPHLMAARALPRRPEGFPDEPGQAAAGGVLAVADAYPSDPHEGPLTGPPDIEHDDPHDGEQERQEHARHAGQEAHGGAGNGTGQAGDRAPDGAGDGAGDSSWWDSLLASDEPAGDEAAPLQAPEVEAERAVRDVAAWASWQPTGQAGQADDGQGPAAHELLDEPGNGVEGEVEDPRSTPTPAAAVSAEASAGADTEASTDPHEADAAAAPGMPGALGGAAAGASQDEDQVTGAPEGEQAHAQEALEAVMAHLLDPESGLTSSTRRFTRVDAIAAVADALPDGAGDIAEIEALTDRALADAGIIPLPEAPAAGEQAATGQRHQLAAAHMANADRYTTADVVAAEQVILAAAAASALGQDAAYVQASTVDLARQVVEAGQGFALSEEQIDVLTALVTSDKAIDTVLGPPGTGKTTLMRAARTAWEAEGYVVAGAATAAVAAANLSAESGIASRTVAQLVWSIRDAADSRACIANGYVPTWDEGGEPLDAVERRRVDRSAAGGLTGVDVLVLDEANLADDRDRAVLYREAVRTGTKLVEIGDPLQLRGVGCGSLFGRVHQLVGGMALTANRRQHDEDERTAIAAWRGGSYATALTSWSDRGRLVATETGDQALTAMVAAWMHQRAGAPDAHAEMRGVVMLAASNESVDRLNDAAQAVRAAAGELGAARTYAVRAGRHLTLHEGDYVLIRLNDRAQRRHSGPDVLNGYRGVVEGIDAHGSVRVAWQREVGHGRIQQRACLQAAYVAAGGLSLGYAMTGHKAEGLTVAADWTAADGRHQGGSVLVYAPGMDTPGLHVATSRHRDQMLLFAGRDQLESAAHTYEHGVPGSDRQRATRVIDALAREAKARETNANDRPVHDDLALTYRPGSSARPARGEAPLQAGMADQPATEAATEAASGAVRQEALREQPATEAASEAAPTVPTVAADGVGASGAPAAGLPAQDGGAQAPSPVPAGSGGRQGAPAVLAPDEQRLALLGRINAEAAAFYRAQLADAAPAAAVRTYLDQRGVGPAAREAFEVGYAPASWSALTDHLRARGYAEEDLLAAGVATNTRHATVVDRFRDRIMFPLREPSGQDVVAFLGRAVHDGQGSKYLNTPATELYRKSQVLYGLGAAPAREHLVAGARAVIVEGPMDAIAVTCASGGTHVGVAPCGTALTADQVEALDTHAGPLAQRAPVVVFDNDAAGRTAAARAFEVLRSAGTWPQAATLPEGADPAQLVEERGAATLAEALTTNLHPLADVAVEARIRPWAEDLQWAEGRVGALRAAAPLVASFPPGEVYRQIRHLRGRLELDADIVEQEILTAVATRAATQPSAPSASASASAAAPAPAPAPPSPSTGQIPEQMAEQHPEQMARATREPARAGDDRQAARPSGEAGGQPTLPALRRPSPRRRPRRDVATRWAELTGQAPIEASSWPTGAHQEAVAPAAAEQTQAATAMSRYEFATSDDQHWQVGWDPTMASLYAQVAPAPTPGLPNGAANDALTDAARDLVAVAADPTGSDRAALVEAIGNLGHEVAIHDSTTSDAPEVQLVRAARAAAGLNVEDDDWAAMQVTIARLGRALPDAPAGAQPGPTGRLETRLETVVGGQVGQAPSVQALQDLLDGQVVLPSEVRERLARDAEAPHRAPTAVATAPAGQEGLVAAPAGSQAEQRLTAAEERELQRRAQRWAALSTGPSTSHATSRAVAGGAEDDRPGSAGLPAASAFRAQGRQPAGQEARRREQERREQERREEEARRAQHGRGPRL